MGHCVSTATDITYMVITFPILLYLLRRTAAAITDLSFEDIGQLRVT